jgi:UDP-2,4-diacetamido-2,4,6-trideoxy-beta-L-altropyranose hydrolase
MAEDSAKARPCGEKIESHLLNAQPGSIEDAVKTKDFARRLDADWIITDGYQFGADYQRAIKESGAKLLFIDDYGQCDHYYADIVLNQNLGANEDLYRRREHYTRLLLGPEYVLLRREFLRYRGLKREIPEVGRRVLVTFGGVDRQNMTLKVIRALGLVDVPGLHAQFVVGRWNPHVEEIEAAIGNLSFAISLKRDAIDMAALMAWADLAVSAAGITTWELAFMGLPSLAVVTSENQRSVAAGADMAGISSSLGWYDRFSSSELAERIAHLLKHREIRERMSRSGQKLIDGDGASRVLAHATE